MQGCTIVQQAPDFGCVQIQPHVCDPFQQLVEHTFVEVCVDHEEQTQYGACHTNQKTQSTSSSHTIFATAVFVVSETPGPSIPHSVV